MHMDHPLINVHKAHKSQVLSSYKMHKQEEHVNNNDLTTWVLDTLQTFSSISFVYYNRVTMDQCDMRMCHRTVA